MLFRLPEILALAVIAMAINSGCRGEETAVVVRLDRAAPVAAGSNGNGGTGSDGGIIRGGGGTSGVPEAGAAAAGPGNAYWSLYADQNGTAEWATPPTATSVAVNARAPADVRAGLKFEFADHQLHDLSQFYEVALDVEVTDGDSFELFLGRGLSEGCSYVIPKGQTNSYSTNLSSPVWCVPTQCGFDLKATGGFILAYVPTDSRLSARVTDLEFRQDPTGLRAGSASGLGGAKGPGGFCWFLVNWNQMASAGWFQTNPTSSSVHVLATASANGIAGMALEVPSGFGLSRYRTLVLDATVSGGTAQPNTTFLVQAVRLAQGRGWVLQGDGKRQTYRIDLVQPGYYFGGSGQLALDEVQRIEIVAQSNGGSATIDALVQGIELQP